MFLCSTYELWILACIYGGIAKAVHSDSYVPLFKKNVFLY